MFVHYEDLLSDPEAEIRRLAGYLDITVDEDHFPALLERIVAWATLILFPLGWFVGAFLGQFFNRGNLFLIPFLLNLLPACGMLWMAIDLSRDGAGGPPLTLSYLGLLVALLIGGLTFALAALRD